MNAILEPILQSSKIHLIAEELNSYIKNEQQNRMDFYKTVTEQQKAEFINGEIKVQSPVTLKHNVIVSRLSRLLTTFVSINDLGFVGVEKVLIKLLRNDYEPDICYFTKEKAKDFGNKTMFFPAPDFVVEVLSKSTEKIDRTIKKEDYAVNKIKEYWIIDSENEIVEQYLLHKNEYVLNLKINEGILHNKVIKGFDIEVDALFNDATCNINLKKIINGN
jgi:Uma2 family endonuclease